MLRSQIAVFRRLAKEAPEYAATEHVEKKSSETTTKKEIGYYVDTGVENDKKCAHFVYGVSVEAI